MPSSHVFTGITSEGGILPTDFLAELTSPKSDIEGLDPTTYRLAPGERIGDQVNRSWNRLKGCWVNFLRSISAKQPGEPTTTETRERWLFPLFQELDFGRLTAARPIEVDGKSYPVSHGWGSVPIHLVGTHVDLDRRTPGAVGATKASPHSLVQQVLNASDNHLWGIISNGFTLRLVRDNVALTRIAYLEWDLQAIFDGDLYPEFFLLWLVCHQTRFEPSPDGRPDQCWIEKWKKQAEEKGLRALENLRPGVEKAIASIGSGLVSHKANQTLRSKLSSGQLSTQDFYRQILRIIYRMLFLFVAEDRGLLHPSLPGDDQGKEAMESALKARQRYRDFYSIGRLRDLTLHRAGTPHPDLWQVFQLVSRFLGFDSGSPELALPALGSFLWSPQAAPDLEDCLISNRHFLEAVHALAFIRDGNVRRAIDYKNLGAEELGSVYESLLELHPIVNADAGAFELKTAAGHERKTTGSYYTDDSLVQSLLGTALEPVIAETVKGKEGAAAAEALLKLKICDLAVGSGHFLIGAAHRLARRVAAARTGEEEPSPEAIRSALREVIGRCLYGVDINPMAAELCRVSLWLEALEPGKPLSFLDHHIRVGNSLLGATPELIAGGLPDEAFNPIEGDDRKFCSALKKKNKEERAGQRSMLYLMVAESQTEYNSIESRTREIDESPDSTIDEIHRKAEQFHRLVVSPEYQHARQIADAWCAAFVWRKQKGTPFEPITTDTIRRLEEDPNALSPGQKEEVERLAAQYWFFHWHLAFPEVFVWGGFDCVLGNPPWEMVELSEKEFFAHRALAIANASSARQRQALILKLEHDDPSLWVQFREARRLVGGSRHFIQASGRYARSSVGRINLYPLFTELAAHQLSPKGRAGIIVPSAISMDAYNAALFGWLLQNSRVVSLFDFENAGELFPSVHRSYRFCLLTLAGADGNSQEIGFCYFAHSVEELREPRRRVILSQNDILDFSPNTLAPPILQRAEDKEIATRCYRRIGIFHDQRDGRTSAWRPAIQRMLSLSDDGDFFRRREELPETIPDDFERLYSGKTIHAFNHRFATFDAQDWRPATTSELSDPSFLPVTEYYARRDEVVSRLAGKWPSSWLIGYRDIARATDERTSIAAIIPRVGCDTHCRNIYLGVMDSGLAACLVSNMNAFAFDYFARQKIIGTGMGAGVLEQLPVIPPSMYTVPCPWSGDSPWLLGAWLFRRALELTYSAWDLEPFAQDCGCSGPPFRWDEERRFLLRCELDAAFFHLYLPATADGQWKPSRIADGAMRDETPEELSELKRHFPAPRDAVAYIMDTFPIVRRKDEEKHGEYRTKRVILEIYDEMAQAIRTGNPYQTRLTPPPGPPADEHGNFLPLPEWNPGQPKPPNWPRHIHPPREVS
jgi:hypothetical protein